MQANPLATREASFHANRKNAVGRVAGGGEIGLLLTSIPPTALADNVVADDQIVQGNLCVGTPCVDGKTFALSPELLL